MDRFGLVSSFSYSALNPNSHSSLPTRSTVLTCARITSASSVVSGGRFIALRRCSSLENPAGHFCTWKTCEPRMLISFSIVPCTTEIAVMTEMIDAMPATMPSSVRHERSLLPTMARSDMCRMSEGTTMRLLIAERLHRIEPGAAHRGHQAGKNPDGDRHTERRKGNGQRQGGRHHGGIDHGRQAGGNKHADEPAAETDRCRLEQELRQDAVR